MSHYFKLCLLILLFFVTTTGCAVVDQTNSGEEQEIPVPDEIPDGTTSQGWEDLVFERVEANSLDGDLREKLGGNQVEQGMRIVEDSGYKYILVSAGRKPTEGYYIRVGSLVGFEKHIVLNALLYSPCETDTVEPIATYPSLLIRILADEREVILFLTDTRNTYLG